MPHDFDVVSVTSGKRRAHFVNQFVVRSVNTNKSFARNVISGPLMLNSSRLVCGLLFAASSSVGFAAPINRALRAFGVRPPVHRENTVAVRSPRAL